MIVGDTGYNPNLFNQFIGVTVTEGLRADHREESLLSGNYTSPTPNQQRCIDSIKGSHPDDAYDLLQCGSGFEYGDRLTSLADVNSFSTTSAAPCSDGGIDVHRFIVLRGNHVASNGGFHINAGSDIIMEHNTVADFEHGFSAAPLTRGGPYMEQPLAAPLPFAITNFTGAVGVSTQAIPTTNWDVSDRLFVATVPRVGLQSEVSRCERSHLSGQ